MREGAEGWEMAVREGEVRVGAEGGVRVEAVDLVTAAGVVGAWLHQVGNGCQEGGLDNHLARALLMPLAATRAQA